MATSRRKERRRSTAGQRRRSQAQASVEQKRVGSDSQPPIVIVREPWQRGPGLEDELKAFVLQELAPYKHPREIVFVDDLPRTHLGKVDRGKLKSWN